MRVVSRKSKVQSLKVEKPVRTKLERAKSGREACRVEALVSEVRSEVQSRL